MYVDDTAVGPPPKLPGRPLGDLRRILGEAPTSVPALVAIALFVVWAGSEAGYPLTRWAPGALIVLCLLAIAVIFVGSHAPQPRGAVRVALGCLAAYTAFSFISIAWASVPGDALEGADRTLLYLLVFALFACWPQTGRSAGALLVAWLLAMSGLCLFVALRLGLAGEHELTGLIPGGRMIYPAGYANAAAAQWLIAFWPAVMLARSNRVHWALRGTLAGAAVLLAAIALLSQSRGSFYATPVMLVLVFALLPERVRTFAVLLPVSAAIAVAVPFVLDVGDHLHGGAVVASTVHRAVAVSLAAALLAGLAVASAAAAERRLQQQPARRARLRRGLAAGGLAALLLAILAVLVAAGNPVTRVRHAWDTFKGGYGADSTTGTRLLSGLGSNRYDFYRVAVDEFAEHPLLGIGADNFQQQYLVHGRSTETPRYPHSVELRVLADTGLIGAVIALVGLAASLLATARATRSADPLARVVACAAICGFGYWVVHGSFDWFWEFAGLGAPAFALLGLACALSRRSVLARGAREGDASQARGSRRRDPPRRWRWPALPRLAGLACLLGAAVLIAAPWLSQLEIQSAAAIWRKSPTSAYSRLATAGSLDPLSDQAAVLAGSIAMRYEQLPRAAREFERALGRSADDAYATLALGAVRSALGQSADAQRLLERAVSLDPRSQLPRAALAVIRRGGRVSIRGLTRAILLEGREFA